MMPGQCPLCGQDLPQTLTHEKLHARLEKLAKSELEPALRAEKEKLQEQFEAQLTAEKEMARQRAERAANRELTESRNALKVAQKEARNQIRNLERDVESRIALATSVATKSADKAAKKELEQFKRHLEGRMKSQVADAVLSVSERGEAQMEKVQTQLEKERLRHEADRAKLLTQVEILSRKLENRTGQQLGDEAEIDLFAVLREAFQSDTISRVKKGVRGGDILHDVTDQGRLVGRIIYESKNDRTWKTSFIAQAKKYKSQYETGYVVVVSRTFPRSEKDFCIVGGIPVVSPAMAVSLATILRETVVAVGKYRETGVAPDQKARKLLDFVISDRFVSRFQTIAESVTSLTDEVRKEKSWHEKNWERRTDLQERIDACHRQIHAQVNTIIRESPGKKPLQFAASAR